MTKQWFHETLYPTYCQSFKIENVLWEGKSSYQDILIFENKEFGKVMALDGAVQFTTNDEFIYHEMLTPMYLYLLMEMYKTSSLSGVEMEGLHEKCLSTLIFAP